MAAKVIAETIKTSLGPKGMDKMLIAGFGDITITNDGATILKEMDIQHPAAKMMAEVSKSTDTEVGDGTTSVVVLAGKLLEKAEVKPEDREMLRKVAMTTMASKMISGNKERLADIAIDAVLKVAEETDDGYTVDVDDIKVEKKAGESIDDTKLIEGIVLDKEVVHSGMPKVIREANIALINAAIEIEKTEISAKINIENPDEMKAFLDEEERTLKGMADTIVATGANVLLCQKGIDDLPQYHLAKSGVLAVRRVSESNMEKLAKATGGKIVSNIDDITADDLGYAKIVEERKIGDDKWVFIEGCKNPRAVSILVRGGTSKVVDEVDRSIHDAICVVRDIVQRPFVVAGGGAPEVEVASQLRKWAETLSGKEQLAALEFSEALEAIPRALAENAGLDPVDILVDLRANHGKGAVWAGVYPEGGVRDMAELDVYEPLVVKEQVIKSASEVASMILRIDDVIASGKSPMGPPGGGPGGMPGGMPGLG
jgi:chaperonin GroEL (HSP60 family)